jgi:hypothetical protein
MSATPLASGVSMRGLLLLLLLSFAVFLTALLIGSSGIAPARAL